MGRVLAVALVAVSAGALVSTAAADAATKRVIAGPPVNQRPPGMPRDADSNAFYPRTVTIHRGDRVRWEIRGFHTVTIPARGQRPPDFAIPDLATPLSGVTDAAGSPFWFNGQPRLLVNPLVAFRQGGASYTGRRLLNSGAPLSEGPPPPYSVRFRRTGTFRYFCQIHTGNPTMRGTVRVVNRRRSIPSAADDRAAAARQFARVRARIRSDARFPGPSGNRVSAGVETTNSVLLRFRPAVKTVSAGATVSFVMSRRSNEAHTVSFGPAPYLAAQAEGLITPAPAGGPLLLNPIAALPSDPPPLPPYQGTNHGNGFLNSGLIDRDPRSPFPAVARMAFVRPGSYDYICILHPDTMKGRIVVTA